MKNIYRLLKQRLSEIADLKEVLWYTGQYLQTGDQSIYVDKAAYIEFMPLSWTTLSRNIQEAVLEFDVHLLTEALNDNDERILDADIAHLSLVEQVYKKLQRWQAHLSDLPEFTGQPDTPKIINSIVRTNLAPDHTLSNLIVTVQKFQCTVYDLSALPQYQQVNANLSITIDIP